MTHSHAAQLQVASDREEARVASRSIMLTIASGVAQKARSVTSVAFESLCNRRTGPKSEAVKDACLL